MATEKDQKPLEPNAWFDYFQINRVSVMVTADRVINGKVDMSKQYARDLAPGRYLGRITYLYASEPSQLVTSAPFSIVIVEPTKAADKEAMKLLIDGRDLFNAHLMTSASDKYENLIEKHKSTEYARVGRYYQALISLELNKYDDAVKVLQEYLKAPALCMPSSVTPDYIHLLMGRALDFTQ